MSTISGSAAVTDLLNGTSSDSGPIPAYAQGSTLASQPHSIGDPVLSSYIWQGSSVTYSFATVATNYESEIAEASNGFGAVSFAQQQAFRYILEGTSSIAGGPVFHYGSFESLILLSISEIANPADGSFNTADIRVAQSSLANPTAYAYYPAPDDGGPAYSGDVWFGTQTDYSNPIVGSTGWHAAIHELGHAFGLKHGHETDVYGALPADRDSLEFSVMTYRSYVGGPASFYMPEEFGGPQTLMMYDIAALQEMYGADFATNASNTIYTWNPATGEMSLNGVAQGAPGANRIFLTTWDGGGNDTYDFSNYVSLSVDAHPLIDLRPGAWTNLTTQIVLLDSVNGDQFAHGNIYNSFLYHDDARSYIENAIGTSVGDVINGNDIANVLQGGDGNDTLYGGAGDDTLSSDSNLNYKGANFLEGGDGNDTLIGGPAFDALDTAYYGNATGSVVVDLAAGTATGQGTDTLYYIESAIGSGFADTLFGSDAANTLMGGGGADTLDGGVGNDVVAGGAGADTFYFTNAGDDTFTDFNPGEGDKLFYGFAGAQSVTVTALGHVLQFNVDGVISTITAPNYTWTGLEPIALVDDTTGANTLVGGAAADTFYGGGGNDALYGGDGNDSLYGGTGDDTLSSDANLNYKGSNFLEGGDGNDTLIGGPAFDAFDTAYYGNATGPVVIDLAAGTATGQGSDTLYYIESVIGSDFADTLFGSNGANTLNGGGGNDTLDGGAGNDVIVGGAGADTFYFTDAGDDTFTDFNPGEGDKLFYDFVGAQNVTITALGHVLQFNVDGVLSTITAPDYTWTGLEPIALGGGSDGANTLVGGAGADTFYGGAGNDALYGGDGNDTLYGGTGDDTLSGDGNLNYKGANYVDGGDGNDTLIGGPAFDAFDTASYAGAAGSVIVDLAAGTATGQGSDTLYYVESVIGSGFADTLIGSNAANTLSGGGGNDTLDGAAGNDVIVGGAGGDTFVFANAGDDTFTDFNPGEGDKLLYGFVGAQNVTITALGHVLQFNVDGVISTITAPNYTWTGSEPVAFTDDTAGANTLIGGAAADTFYGGGGNDALYGGDGNDWLYGGTGDDTLSSDANLNYKGSNFLEGGDGNDTLIGGPAFDAFDTAYYGNATGPVVVDLAAGTATGQGTDTLYYIESVIGSGFADTLVGSNAVNTLIGGLGNDILTGGGADLFAYAAGDGNDIITDFNAGQADKVDLTGVAFDHVGATGNIAVLSNGATITAQTGYVWTGSEFV